MYCKVGINSKFSLLGVRHPRLNVVFIRWFHGVYFSSGDTNCAENSCKSTSQVDRYVILLHCIHFASLVPLARVPHYTHCIKKTDVHSIRQGSQVGVVVISRAFRLYDPGSIPGLCTWVEICRSQSDPEGFSPGTLFLPLQIRLSLKIRAVEQLTLASG